MADNAPNDNLRERRLAIVREHMESENKLDFDVTMATFEHPRYEIVPTSEVCAGPEAVATYFKTTRMAFPDQRNENTTLHIADEAIIAEFDLLGTHRGELRGIPPPAAASAAACARSSSSRRRATTSSASASTSTRRPSHGSSSAKPAEHGTQTRDQR